MNTIVKSLEPQIGEWASRGESGQLVEALLALRDRGKAEDDLYTICLLAKAIENQSDDAAVVLGEEYQSGKCLAVNPEKGRAIFERAANNGNARGLYDFGIYYCHQKEYARAIEQFERCLKSKNLDESMLALCHGALGDSYSRLSTPQYGKAVDNLTIAADKYHIPYATLRLGLLFMEQSNPSEKKKGLPYLEQAAKNGNAEAASTLAELYIYGDDAFGILPDESKAKNLLNPFANSDHVGAQYLLGYLNLFGVVGEGAKGRQGAAAAVGHFEKAWNGMRSPIIAEKLGFAYYLLGRLHEARDLWEYVDREKEDGCKYLDFLGRIYVQEFKDKARGLSCYDRAYRSETGLANYFTYSEYVDLLLEAGRYSDAFSVSDEGDQRFNDIKFFYQKAELVLSGKCPSSKPYEYVQMMQACVEYEGYGVKARRVLADYYARTGNVMDARAQLKQLYDLCERDAAFNLGVMYASDPLLAIDWYTKAFASGSVEAALRIADTYEKALRNTDKAVEWYSKAANAGSLLAAQELAKFKQTMFGHYKRIG